jgi:hypothetical protein
LLDELVVIGLDFDHADIGAAFAADGTVVSTRVPCALLGSDPGTIPVECSEDLVRISLSLSVVDLFNGPGAADPLGAARDLGVDVGELRHHTYDGTGLANLDDARTRDHGGAGLGLAGAHMAMDITWEPVDRG